MIYRIPENWDYNESLELLYLFYQKADELLSETSPNTYSLPLHNSMTLLSEAEEIFNLLNEYEMVAEYYGKYIPPILEELLEQLEDDYILKKNFRLSLIQHSDGPNRGPEEPYTFKRMA